MFRNFAINIIWLPDERQHEGLDWLSSIPDASLRLFPIVRAGADCRDLDLQCESLLKEGLVSAYKPLLLSNSESVEKLINKSFSCSLDPRQEQFIFFLSPHVRPEKACLSRLFQELKADTKLSGVNPVLLAGWLDNDKRLVAHMGTVFDCQKKLHYLYEGIPADSPLLQQKRLFQLAHPGALLVRQMDFARTGGFDEKLGFLSFPSLCLAINKGDKKGFSTIPESLAILNNQLDSWEFCASWNSILQRGRLDTSAVRTDYPLFVRKDFIRYRIDPWLNEHADLANPDSPEHAWLEWRRNPTPHSLLKYLASLPDNNKAQALNLAQTLPSSLPRLYSYYPVQLERISSVAHELGHSELVEQCNEWLKKKRRFHYGQLKPGMKLLREAGIYNCSLDQSPSVYDAWVELEEKFEKLETGVDYPEMAVLMPVWNPEPRFLIQALDSVLAQEYPKWQLCIADDASTNPEIREILQTYERKEKRIKVRFREQNGHICKASNSALKLVTAPYTAFLDHDDLLSPFALAQNALQIAKNPNLAFLFSDNDCIDENNVRRSPVFKPGFDADLFFTGHLSVYSTSLIRDIGGLRPGTEGAQDQDLRFRACELLTDSNIVHLPYILYHWRVHANSTSATLQAKPYVVEASKKALLDAATRNLFQAEVYESERNNFFRLLYKLPPDLNCSVVLYSNRNSTPSRSLLQEIERLRQFLQIELIIEQSDRSWLEICNSSAQKAQGKIVAFLDVRLEMRPGCRLDQLIFMAARDDLAMTGGLVWQGGRLLNGGYYPDINGLPFPLLQGEAENFLPKAAWSQFLLPRHVLGVPKECMVIKKEILEEGSFLDPAFGDLATVDFALRQRQKNRNCLVSPWGQWQLDDNSSLLTTDKKAYEAIQKRWGTAISRSSLRNPNLRAAPDRDWTLIL